MSMSDLMFFVVNIDVNAGGRLEPHMLVTDHINIYLFLEKIDEVCMRHEWKSKTMAA